MTTYIERSAPRRLRGLELAAEILTAHGVSIDESDTGIMLSEAISRVLAEVADDRVLLMATINELAAVAFMTAVRVVGHDIEDDSREDGMDWAKAARVLTESVRMEREVLES